MHALTHKADDEQAQEVGMPFVPVELTPLAFTSAYSSLSECQQLRYNRLYGYYFLEQTIFFEQHMGRPVLEHLLKLAPSSSLRELSSRFIQEENLHSGWFHDLLRTCEPAWYRRGRFHLLRAGTVEKGLLSFAVNRPTWFPFLLWLQIIAEERAQYFSTVFIRHAGELHPRFVAVQRKHLADEAGHIRWDVELIEWLWPATPRWLRVVNAHLLGWTLQEFFYLPKRSGWNVVEQLLAEFPELEPRRADLREAASELGSDHGYLATLYPRSIFPRTRRLASRWPELRFLERFFTD